MTIYRAWTITGLVYEAAAGRMAAKDAAALAELAAKGMVERASCGALRLAAEALCNAWDGADGSGDAAVNDKHFADLRAALENR